MMIVYGRKYGFHLGSGLSIISCGVKCEVQCLMENGKLA